MERNFVRTASSGRPPSRLWRPRIEPAAPPANGSTSIQRAHPGGVRTGESILALPFWVRPWFSSRTDCSVNLILSDEHSFTILSVVGLFLIRAGLFLGWFDERLHPPSEASKEAVRQYREYLANQPQVSRAERELLADTGKWKKPLLIRSYPNDTGGLKRAEEDATILVAHGYDISAQSGVGSHVDVGRAITRGCSDGWPIISVRRKSNEGLGPHHVRQAN